MTITTLIDLLQKYATSDCKVAILQDNGYGLEAYTVEGIRVVIDADGTTVSVVIL